MGTALALLAIAVRADGDGDGSDGEEEETLEQGADCTEGTCGEGLCCGTATEALEEGAEGDPATKTVCNDATAEDFVDEEDPDIPYTFACNPEETDGATKLAAGMAVFATLALM